MVAIIRLFLGFVCFRISGMFSQRFISDCMNSGIRIWNLTECDGGYTCCARASAYRQCCKLAKKNHTKIRLSGKTGLPFLRRRYRKRIGLLIGIAAFFAVLWFLSGYIWNIQIIGNSRLTNAQILDALSRQGISIGTSKTSINNTDTENKLFLTLDDIAWVTVYSKGTTLYVELTERSFKPPMLPKDSPANVVASRTAQILRIDVYNGQAVVKAGEGVAAGQLVVSGVWMDRNGGHELVHADAYVWAAVTEEKVITVSLTQPKTIVDGKISTRFRLLFLGFQIPLYTGLPSEYTDVTEKDSMFTLFGTQFPLGIAKIQYEKTKTIQEKITPVQAEAIAFKRLSDYETQEFKGALIKDKKTTIKSTDSGIVLTAVYEVNMDIAQEKEIIVR